MNHTSIKIKQIKHFKLKIFFFEFLNLNKQP